MMLIYWRPKGMHEAIPAAIGAAIILVSGAVSFSNLIDISAKVSGAAVTIISTFIMALVLESIGFFIGSPLYWPSELTVRVFGCFGIRMLFAFL